MGKMKEIANLQLNHEKSTIAFHITISLGVASMIPSCKIVPETLIKMADDSLYKAKENGRNRVEFALATEYV